MTTPVIDMTEQDFLHLVAEMRRWQSAFFRAARETLEKDEALRESKWRERAVDAYLAIHLPVETGLFAEQAAEEVRAA